MLTTWTSNASLLHSRASSETWMKIGSVVNSFATAGFETSSDERVGSRWRRSCQRGREIDRNRAACHF